MLAFVISPVFRKHIGQPGSFWPGLEIFPDGLLQNRVIQRQMRHDLLQPGVFRFQFLQPMGLIDSHAAIFFSPTVISLFRNGYFSTDLSNRRALPNKHFGLSDLSDDLFRRKPYPAQDDSFLSGIFSHYTWIDLRGAGQVCYTHSSKKMEGTFSEIKPGDLKTKAVKGASANIVAQFVSILCQTIGVVILARLLKPADFGLVAMVTAFSVWLSNFGVNGFTEYIIQKQGISSEEVTSIYWTHLLIATTLAVGFVFFGFVLVDLNGEPALSGIAAALSITIVFQALSTSHIALLKREMRFAPVAVAELVGVILSIVFAIAAAVGGMGYWAVVIRQLTGPAVLVLASRILCPWRPKGSLRFAKVWPSLKYAVQIYSNISLAYLTHSLDKVLLGKYHGAQLLGNYDRAYYIFTMPAAQLLTPLHNVALATLSRLKNDRAKYFDYYGKAVSLIAFPGILASLILTVSAQDLVTLLLGPNWTEAGRVVVAFGPSIGALLVYGTSSWLYLSLGTPNRWLRWNIFAAIVTVIAFVVAAPIGAVAMATAYSLRTYLIMLPSIWYAGRPVQLNLRVVLRNLWPYFFSGIAVGAGWLLLLAYVPPMKELIAGLSPILRILVATGVSSVLYVVSVAILQGSFISVREILSLVPYIFSRPKP